MQLLCSVLEQVIRFRELGYPADGRTESEIDFEDVLEVNKDTDTRHYCI